MMETRNDPKELGLRASALDLALRREDPLPAIPNDDAPFDPEAEAELAERIVVYVDTGFRPLLHFTEPPFQGIPSKERADWWIEHLNLPSLGEPPRAISFGLAVGSSGLVGAIEAAMEGMNFHRRTEYEFILLFARAVAHLLTPEERARLEQRLTLPLPTVPVFPGQHGKVDGSPFLAVTLGLPDDQIRACFDGGGHDQFGSASQALLAPTAEERVEIAERRKLNVAHPSDAVAWLAATGTGGLPALQRRITQSNKQEALAFAIELAAALDGPGALPVFLQLLGTAGSEVARQWIDEHVDHLFLVDLDAKQALAVAGILRTLPEEQLRSGRDTASAPVQRIVDEILAQLDLPELDDDGWWSEALALTTDEPKTQKVADAESLPPLVADGRRLSTAQVAHLLDRLASPTFREDPLVLAVREHTDLRSRDRFATDLFEQWRLAGAVTKHSWMMIHGGFLGDDEFVHHLTPMIREWPGQSQHKRAVNGLEALRNVGTTTALQQLAGIAAKVKFAGLKRRAGEAMDEIAEDQGLAREQLEDRIIPSDGLDGHGRRVFDYGARRFVAHLTGEGKVVTRLLDADGNPTGKPKTTLPAPNKSDDPEMAQEAKAEFNLLKKNLTQVMKIQAGRFEQAMVSGRRWTGEEFRSFIAPNPILRGLLSGVVWGLWEDDELVATARLDEDGNLVDADDETVELAGSVTVVHPLELDDATREQWAEVLADYELTTPFKQLDRPIHTLDVPAKGTSLTFGDAPKVPAGRFVGAFSRHGWERGDVLDAGVYYHHLKYFERIDATAVIEFEGLYIGAPTEAPDQKVEQVCFLPGRVRSLGWHSLDKLETTALEQIPPVVLSEVLMVVEDIMGGTPA